MESGRFAGSALVAGGCMWVVMYVLEAFPELTEREEEILSLIAGGHDNAEIAGRLFLSLKTVQNHVSNIFRKLRVADRVQAALRAREAGLGG